jgi:hypothetical protein
MVAAASKLALVPADKTEFSSPQTHIRRWQWVACSFLLFTEYILPSLDTLPVPVFFGALASTSPCSMTNANAKVDLTLASGNNSPLGNAVRQPSHAQKRGQLHKDQRQDYGDEEADEHQSRGRRSNDRFIDNNLQASTTVPQVDDAEPAAAATEKPVSWSSLPRKDQLLVLTLARLSEPLTQTSLGSYLFYQLQSFDPSLPDSTISYQAGVINAAFPAAQFLTAMLWGRIADAEYGGRKRVLYIGLLGTLLSIIGFGFSHSFPMAVAFRCLGGVLNGNIGVMRTMISEIIKEKKYQSRAFLILPITFNIGVIIGPILGTQFL